MKSDQWLQESTKQLERAGIVTARLDALVLLTDVTRKDRAHLLAHPEIDLTEVELSELERLLSRRVQHEPLAYIRGKTEFYGRKFVVNKHVLVPRPESETIIELLKKHPQSLNIKTIVDVGTGSGALAITAKLEFPDSQVFGLDVDPACLEVARKNADIHNADVKFLQSDLLCNLPITAHKSPTTIIANLPYVPNDYPVNQAAKHEPKLALFGGDDGLDLYRTMFAQLADSPIESISVYTESLPSQHDSLSKIATKTGFTQTQKSDFIQVFVKA